MTEPTRSAVAPPAPISTQLMWTRAATGRVPPEGDARMFLLQLADGSFVVGRRRTVVRVQRGSGFEIVRGSVVPTVPTLTTHFADAAAGMPIDHVRWYAPIEPPP